LCELLRPQNIGKMRQGRHATCFRIAAGALTVSTRPNKERQMNRNAAAAAVTAVLMVTLSYPSLSSAHLVSRSECVEGSQFIMDGALARDHGVPRETYIGQLLGDIETIKAFPVELRWFVQDDEDAALLVSAAKEVYDDPAPPEKHRQAFLSRCLGRPTTNS